MPETTSDRHDFVRQMDLAKMTKLIPELFILRSYNVKNPAVYFSHKHKEVFDMKKRFGLRTLLALVLALCLAVGVANMSLAEGTASVPTVDPSPAIYVTQKTAKIGRAHV